MPVEITMPQLSDTMNEGRILTWLKKEGDSVKRGDALAEVATDKADLEIESFHDGTLVKIHAPEGTTVQVGSVIALIGDAASAPAPSKPAAQASAPQAAAPVQVAPAPAPSAAPARPAQNVVQMNIAPTAAPQVNGESADGERVKISPLARNIAHTYGVDFAALQGSGEGGRIVKRDVEQQLGQSVSAEAVLGATSPAPASIRPTTQSAPQASAPAPRVVQMPTGASASNTPAARPIADASGQFKSEPLSKMREAIAQRMAESLKTIPHFYVTSKIAVEAVAKLRNSLKTLPQYEGLTYNHLIIRAAALALRAVPRINAAYRDNQLLQPHEVNVGIITAVPDGLLIPVVRNADQLPLADIVAEARTLVQRARSGRPKSGDLVGGTFSISNMGMFPVESFTAIISPNQGAILAVSGIQDEALVVDGKVQVGPVLRLTLSVDHRIIDGVMAGEFLKEMKRLLEDPVLLLA